MNLTRGLRSAGSNILCAQRRVRLVLPIMRDKTCAVLRSGRPTCWKEGGTLHAKEHGVGHEVRQPPAHAGRDRAPILPTRERQDRHTADELPFLPKPFRNVASQIHIEASYG